MDVRLPDGTVIKNVPEGTTQGELMGRVQRMRAEGDTQKWQQQIKGELTGDMGGGEKFLAGAGKAFTDIGRGTGQLIGMGPSGAEVKEQRQLDAPLMSTGAGMAGNVVGNVAALAPTAFIPGANTYLGAGLIGGAAGALQPTETGQERLMNTGTGAVVAPAALGATRGIAHGIGAMRAAAQPMTEGGQNKIMGALLRRSAGENADDVATRMAGAKELIPGSAPTAGQVSQSGGIAALERAATQAEPEQYATRQIQQNVARLNALRGIAKDETSLNAAKASRQALAGPLYQQAIKKGADPGMAQVLQPQIKNLLERMPKGVMERAKDLARIEGQITGPEGSVAGLHYVKMAIDDVISQQGDKGLGKFGERALLTLKNDLLTVMDDLSPTYGQARQAFAKASPPINQMQVGQSLLNKLEPALTQGQTPIRMNAETFARALREGDTLAQKTTGFEGAKLDQIMTPRQLSTLEALRKDMGRSATASTIGKGVGSNTFQNLAQENLMQQAGVQNLPQLLSRPVQLTNYVLRSVYGSANEEMKKRLAQALLDPAGKGGAAELMKTGLPGPTAKAMAEVLKRGESYLPAASAATGHQ